MSELTDTDLEELGKVFGKPVSRKTSQAAQQPEPAAPVRTPGAQKSALEMTRGFGITPDPTAEPAPTAAAPTEPATAAGAEVYDPENFIYMPSEDPEENKLYEQQSAENKAAWEKRAYGEAGATPENVKKADDLLMRLRISNEGVTEVLRSAMEQNDPETYKRAKEIGMAMDKRVQEAKAKGETPPPEFTPEEILQASEHGFKPNMEGVSGGDIASGIGQAVGTAGMGIVELAKRAPIVATDIAKSAADTVGLRDKTDAEKKLATKTKAEMGIAADTSLGGLGQLFTGLSRGIVDVGANMSDIPEWEQNIALAENRAKDLLTAQRIASGDKTLIGTNAVAQNRKDVQALLDAGDVKGAEAAAADLEAAQQMSGAIDLIAPMPGMKGFTKVVGKAVDKTTDVARAAKTGTQDVVRQAIGRAPISPEDIAATEAKVAARRAMSPVQRTLLDQAEGAEKEAAKLRQQVVDSGDLRTQDFKARTAARADELDEAARVNRKLAEVSDPNIGGARSSIGTRLATVGQKKFTTGMAPYLARKAGWVLGRGLPLSLAGGAAGSLADVSEEDAGTSGVGGTHIGALAGPILGALLGKYAPNALRGATDIAQSAGQRMLQKPTTLLGKAAAGTADVASNMGGRFVKGGAVGGATGGLLSVGDWERMTDEEKGNAIGAGIVIGGVGNQFQRASKRQPLPPAEPTRPGFDFQPDLPALPPREGVRTGPLPEAPRATSIPEGESGFESNPAASPLAPNGLPALAPRPGPRQGPMPEAPREGGLAPGESGFESNPAQSPLGPNGMPALAPRQGPRTGPMPEAPREGGLPAGETGFESNPAVSPLGPDGLPAMAPRTGPRTGPMPEASRGSSIPEGETGFEPNPVESPLGTNGIPGAPPREGPRTGPTSDAPRGSSIPEGETGFESSQKTPTPTTDTKVAGVELGRKVPQYSVPEQPISELSLSEDVPNWKRGADKKTGVVRGKEIKGDPETLGMAPIVVWERTDGRKEVITGRHRLDLFKRKDQTTIPTTIVKEADGFTASDARTLDAENNIRDGQGDVSDYTTYFREKNYTEEQAANRSLLRGDLNDKSYQGFWISKSSDNLFSLFQNGKISGRKAAHVAKAAKGDPVLEAIGINVAKTAPAEAIQSTIQAIQAKRAELKALAGEEAQGDLFANDQTERGYTKLFSEAFRKADEIKSLINKYESAGSVKKLSLADRKEGGFGPNDQAKLEARIAELKQEEQRYRKPLDNEDVYNELMEANGLDKSKVTRVTPKQEQTPTVEEQSTPKQEQPPTDNPPPDDDMGGLFAETETPPKPVTPVEAAPEAPVEKPRPEPFTPPVDPNRKQFSPEDYKGSVIKTKKEISPEPETWTWTPPEKGAPVAKPSAESTPVKPRAEITPEEPEPAPAAITPRRSVMFAEPGEAKNPLKLRKWPQREFGIEVADVRRLRDALTNSGYTPEQAKAISQESNKSQYARYFEEFAANGSIRIEDRPPTGTPKEPKATKAAKVETKAAAEPVKEAAKPERTLEAYETADGDRMVKVTADGKLLGEVNLSNILLGAERDAAAVARNLGVTPEALSKFTEAQWIEVAKASGMINPKRKPSAEVAEPRKKKVIQPDADLLPKEEIPFNLVGEEDITPRLQKEVDARNSAAEAKAKADKEQGDLFEPRKSSKKVDRDKQ